MAVYGAPIFTRFHNENRAHGNDERLSVQDLAAGTNLLLQIVQSVVTTGP
jgi:acetylornithine deacetylase/succinyl-diaminopimelate desuccinylase-like protein